MGRLFVQLASLVLVCSCVEVGVQHCADGTTCAAGTTCGIPSGCVGPGDCGDGLVSPPELCDDGNRRSGDGCAADCASLELCGDAVTNEVLGETCDDGNLASHDGCSSGCPRLQVRETRASVRVDDHAIQVALTTRF